jgi:hypothetical protein
VVKRIDSTLKAVAAVGACACLAATAGCGGGDGGNPVQPGRTWALTVAVASEQKVPVRNATVRVADGQDASKTAITDESGTAIFSALHEGTFTIEVSAAEYYPTTASIALTTSRTVAVTMKERNRAPVITSLVSRGGFPDQVSGLADAGQALDIVATVTDVETAVANLTFDWRADAGTITGTGATARWQAPSSGTWPLTATISVTVTEKYSDPATGPQEHKITGELKVAVHAFTAENAAVALQFLNDFSTSSIAAETVISRSFSTSARCSKGRADELDQVTDNRLEYDIRSSRIGAATVAVHFDSRSPLNEPGDAWIDVPCGWTSLRKADNVIEVVDGLCRLTSVYDGGEWGLCSSRFSANAASAGTRFIR